MGIRARLAQGTICAKLQSRFGKQKGGHWLIDMGDFQKLNSKHKQQIFKQLQSTTTIKANDKISTNEMCGEATNSMTDVESFEDVRMEDYSVNYRDPHNSTHEAVNNEFPKIAEFYSKVINPERPTGKIAEATVKKIIGKAKEFFIFVAETETRSPNIEDCLNTKKVDAFVQTRLAKPLSYGTVAGYVQSILYIAKYVKRNSGNLMEIKEIVQLKRIQSQLQREYEKERRRKNTNTDRKKNYYWGQAMEL
ncbi:uncharacterized protein LOC135693056 [Rhopilema esculentum]|uniref:uncharacterized protein LOC135693056 n=1 Tax=Rhopilema esculentum TaxID=499914 RepID=UPI0031E2BBE2